MPREESIKDTPVSTHRTFEKSRERRCHETETVTLQDESCLFVPPNLLQNFRLIHSAVNHGLKTASKAWKLHFYARKV